MRREILRREKIFLVIMVVAVTIVITVITTTERSDLSNRRGTLAELLVLPRTTVVVQAKDRGVSELMLASLGEREYHRYSDDVRWHAFRIMNRDTLAIRPGEELVLPTKRHGASAK